MTRFIGFQGTGNEIEFISISQSQKAYKVQLVDEPEIELWLPKVAIDDDGSLTDYGIDVFWRNYFEAIGE